MRVIAERHWAVLCASLVAVWLSGCGGQSTSAPLPQALSVSGTVMGGALPITGSHLYLFRANTQGWAGSNIAASTTNASVSLLNDIPGATTADANGNFYVTTGSSGQFNITGDYTACTAGQQLYLYATGGNAMGGDPTLTGGINGNNAAIGVLADLGDCSTVGPGTTVVLNEISTVAAAYALAGFATDATHISDDEGITANTTAALAKTGMANAFANARNLSALNPAAALSTTPAGTGTVPAATLNTIANILADCIQSNGSSSGLCSELFTFTGTPNTMDTATAAIRLAQNPAGVSGSTVSISQLFSDIPPQSAFQPNLATAPNDFTVAILYNVPGVVGAGASYSGPAIDANGSVWLVGGGQPNSIITELSGAGAAYTNVNYPLNGFSIAHSIAVDTTGNVWFANGVSSNGLSELQGSGSTYTVSPVASTAGLSQLTSIAFDGLGNTWVGFASGVYQITGPGVVTAYDSGSTSVNGIAVDAGNRVWASSSTSLVSLSPPVTSGTTYTNTLYSGFLSTSGSGPNDVAIGSDGAAWITDAYGGLLEFTSANTNSAKVTLEGGGSTILTAVAIDGAGDVWAPILSSLLEFTGDGAAISPSTGYTGTAGTAGGTSGPFTGFIPNRISIDGSGNVWVFRDSKEASQPALVQIVGAATPVVTPLVNAVINNKIAAKP